MIDSIIAFSIRQKLIIIIGVFGLIGCGVYSLQQLPIDAVPDVTNNQVQVISIAPSLGAQEVEKYITAPLEIAFANIPEKIQVRSISRSGLSVITIVFKDEADLYLARQLVSEQIKVAQEVIPRGLAVPELAPITTGLGEIYQYVIDVLPGHTHQYSLSDLRTIQDWIVKRQLAGIQGVAEVSSFGGKVKQYEIRLDPSRLNSMQITLSEVIRALEENNENTGGSYIEKTHNAYFIRGEGMVRSLQDIENMVVKVIGNVPVLIKDVATVGYGFAVRYGAMSKNGKGETVGGVVLMLKGSNSEKVIGLVQERIRQIQKTLPEGLRITPFINRAELIDRAISTVKTNLLEGGLIVIFVLVVMLGNLRAGLIVASVIPLSLLFAITMMHVFGVSANLMSLGAIDFGLVVDGAVIIVEAIIHFLAINYRGRGSITGQEMDDGVLQSTVQIRQSAAFGEIIILMVYLPILALSGIEGKMFKPMAQTVAFTIVGALVLSLTYVPMISALVLSKKIKDEPGVADRIIQTLYRYYKPLLLYCLQWRKVILGAVLGLFIFSLFIFSQLGGEFLPKLEEGNFAVEAKIATGSSLSQMIRSCQKAEQILLSRFPEVQQVVSRIGSPEIPTDPMPMENGDLMIILKEKSSWTSAHDMATLAEKMKEALEEVPELQLSFMQPIEMRTNELISGVRTDVGIKIFGDDLDTLLSRASNCASLIGNISGIKDLKIEPIDAVPQIVVSFDRQRIAQYGLTIKEVNRAIKTAFAGEWTGFIYEGEARFDMVIRMDSSKRRDVTDVSNLYIDIPGQNHLSKIPLQQLAKISYQNAPMQVSRENSKRRVSVSFNIRGRDVETTVQEVERQLNKGLILPAGYYFTIGGQFENLIEAKQRLSIAVPIAILMIMVLLYFTFHSMPQAIVIISAIPLSAIGGIFALWMRGMYFSISAGIGFIALFGVAVLNGIVLIGYFNQLASQGTSSTVDRILQGTKVRFRPVLMTAAVASLGFLPMAISTTAGAEVQKPLATVVIGGLVSATLLTLIIIPILYSFISPRSND